MTPRAPVNTKLASGRLLNASVHHRVASSRRHLPLQPTASSAPAVRAVRSTTAPTPRATPRATLARACMPWAANPSMQTKFANSPPPQRPMLFRCGMEPLQLNGPHGQRFERRAHERREACRCYAPETLRSERGHSEVHPLHQHVRRRPPQLARLQPLNLLNARWCDREPCHIKQYRKRASPVRCCHRVHRHCSKGAVPTVMPPIEKPEHPTGSHHRAARGGTRNSMQTMKPCTRAMSARMGRAPARRADRVGAKHHAARVQ